MRAGVAPNSSVVVFLASKDTPNATELYSVPIVGGAIVKLSGQLVVGGSVASSIVSTDSSRAVFQAIKDAPNVYEIYGVPVTGGAVIKLSGSLVAGGQAGGPAISADSSRVVFLAHKDIDEVTELYSVPITDGGSILGVDGGGQILPTTDLLLGTRFRLGLRGAALIDGAFNPLGSRRSIRAIEDRFNRLLEVPKAW